LNPDGTAADDNPFSGEIGADARVYASGFRDPFSFTFAPDGTLYANDNTTINCEELNVVEAGQSYGWPQFPEAAVGQHGFPFPDCAAAPGEQAISHLVREGKNPADFLSFVEVAGLSYLTGTTYSALTDGLIVCEGHKSLVENAESPGVLRRITFTDPGTVLASDVIVKECKGDAVAHNGEVYYSTGSELKKLVPSGDAPVNEQEATSAPDNGGLETPPQLEPAT
jgi:glucose/arabinose dehydrogenase